MPRPTKTDRKSQVSGREEELWELAMRDTKALRKRDLEKKQLQLDNFEQAIGETKGIREQTPKQQMSEESEKAKGAPVKVNPVQHLGQKGRVAGVDRRTAERLRKGQIPIEDTLDMHGMTQSEAHAALKTFISHCANTSRRCVLVITGKGAARGAEILEPIKNRSQVSGVLKQAVPRWLEGRDIREFVITHTAAAKHHGGEGARYLLLRRKRHPKSK